MKKIYLACLLAGISPASPAQEQTGSCSTGRPAVEVVVHRGANRLAPENTFAAIRKALEHGASWIEVDVRTARDGVLYNLHDPSLKRTSNGQGLIRNLNSEEIDRLDAGSWFGPDFAGERIPRIGAVLDSLRGKANVYFDVKDADLPALIRLVREKGYEANSFFWFGNPARQREFIRLAPDLKIKVNASDVSQLQKWLEECRPAIVETGVENITPRFLSFCRSHNIRIMAAVSDSRSYRAVILSGADMVNLDEPDVFEEILREWR